MCTKQLSDTLQSTSINLSQANELVLANKYCYHSDEHWEKMYRYACQVVEMHNISVEVVTRKRKRPACLTENAVYNRQYWHKRNSIGERRVKTVSLPSVSQFLNE